MRLFGGGGAREADRGWRLGFRRKWAYILNSHRITKLPLVMWCLLESLWVYKSFDVKNWVAGDLPLGAKFIFIFGCHKCCIL